MTTPVTLAQLREAAKAAGCGEIHEGVTSLDAPHMLWWHPDVSAPGKGGLVEVRHFSKQRARKLALRVLRGMAL